MTPSPFPEPPVPLSPAQWTQLDQFLKLVLEANTQFNLTAVRDPTEARERHLVECLRLVPLLGDIRTLLDVGSGAGLPGMVLAIARPDVLVTLLESSEKKAQFLSSTAAALRLSNVTVDCRRAEHAGALGEPLREHFDLVTARAVAPLRVLLELTVPFLRVGGRLLAVKGERATEEIAEAQHALQTLHVELEKTERHPTATVLLIAKRDRTPVRYPRRSGEPKQKPL